MGELHSGVPESKTVQNILDHALSQGHCLCEHAIGTPVNVRTIFCFKHSQGQERRRQRCRGLGLELCVQQRLLPNQEIVYSTGLYDATAMHSKQGGCQYEDDR